jgi:cephalosporin hydroxylase
MVILDSDHSKNHVLAELHKYAPLVSQGCYLIVEDTATGITSSEFGPGPAEAVAEFLQGNQDFIVDRDCEKFLLTFNPGGYLRRI